MDESPLHVTPSAAEGNPAQSTSAQMPAAKGWLAVVLAMAAALVVTGGYAVHEGNNVKRMADESAQVQTSLASTNAQMAQLTAKLNELTAPKPVPAPAVTHVATHARKHRPSGISEARWKKMQGQVDDQGRAIDATRQDLVNTRTELTGSIARTHDELVVLERKGERNYSEFDLDKSKRFQAAGPIGVRLRKANVKHQFADLELLVDDVSLTKKHVNLYEPAMFYAADSEHPIEVVVNKVTKNHIHGYVSAPKYRRSELTATSQAPADGTSTSADSSATQQRQRLAVPH